MLGAALLTLAIGLLAYRIPRRRALRAASFLMAATGLGFPGIEGFWPLLVIAFAGTQSIGRGRRRLPVPRACRPRPATSPPRHPIACGRLLLREP
ncbi:hypothetical protein [Microvirga tunisiensis]|uniref:MFS transporter n=1 Tax=Microvirga tunisiensis TaxID=2108360 RepID=A0A5N7MRE8_9HYPH|nr:hypothetical protein [Microvirga tunisiensis]MPR11833.1 MFS transporter [Microvirga tunisiensis]MPR29240.1 MFS transporter [Microvirga tunisiensis]